MTRLTSRLPIAAALLLACVIDAIMTEPASAHVKWFCAFDVAGQPIGLANVLCPDFELLTGLSLLGLMTGSALDVTALGGAIQRALTRPPLICAKISRSSSAPPVRSFSSLFGRWAGFC
jgi:hypothetical protein